MTEDQIKHLVERFLGWRLPDTFRPDNGISFKAPEEERFRAAHWPSGTNLLDYDQAKAMVLHMLKGLPAAPDSVTFTLCAEAPEPGDDPSRNVAVRALEAISDALAGCPDCIAVQDKAAEALASIRGVAAQ